MELRPKGKEKDLDKGSEMWGDFGGRDLLATVNRMSERVCVCAHTRDVEEDMIYYCGKSTWCEAFKERPPRLEPALQATGN